MAADGRPPGSRAAIPLSGILSERAPAKVNLTLHIVGRRDDGWHGLESLVAFSRAGDLLYYHSFLY